MKRRMTVERKRLFNVALSDEERAKLQALAESEDLSVSTLVRRWIRQRYEAMFGDVAPPKRAARR
jgi:predicted transcriptional regulator